ncbi:MSMEG_0567/sll0787 family protein [Rhodococcus jostii]|uniref:Putative N-acetyltransferase, MSMEG_0567 N-terminal domain family n=1 Tax=Rhodococcus jostii TaxID=132919 RepID=A0A1H5M586_RHOJO|nr:MSMEG_0567/sll0787 family protein [Rhodococcus jostii]SEE84354.1 putative N-acetyltransferase, MSMEG_0567 N-terminal domain family [Rhodococcus jostii]
MLDMGSLYGLTTAGPPDLEVLTGPDPGPAEQTFLIHRADTASDLTTYHGLRRETFVAEQGLFQGTDIDDVDDDPRTVVLVAAGPDGTVLGGVRLAPVTDGVDLGWWTGGRLVVDRRARNGHGIGKALVRAACAYAETHGVLRFDATVQSRNEPMFVRLGWERVTDITVAGQPHVLMRWPIDRIERLARSTKAILAEALAPLESAPSALGGSGFRGDDGAPVPGTDLIAACDAIVPSMVERDPEWAGWCAALVNLNDLSAMGADPVGLLDAVGAPNRSILTRVIRGLSRASAAWGVPVLGGHTQVGVPGALSVTALGRTTDPVPAGGGRTGDELRLTADLSGYWRTGYGTQQWDSSSDRTRDELTLLGSYVRRARPAAAKDVSMAGIAGTTGMLAEACGTGAVLDVAAIPAPDGATMGDWITCFPGFAMISADRPGRSHDVDTGPATSTVCGQLTTEPGVGLRWPDGVITRAVHSTVTGLGPA